MEFIAQVMPLIYYLLPILFCLNGMNILFCFTVIVFLNSKIRFPLYWVMLAVKLLNTEKEEMVVKYGQMKALVQGHPPRE